ncbi:hypothetical protein [Myroides odoratus]
MLLVLLALILTATAAAATSVNIHFLRRWNSQRQKLFHFNGFNCKL